MSEGTRDFDPEDPEQREIGREMVDQSVGLGSVAAHLYRGEVDRTVNWRTRLDSTTNWAVTVMSAIVAYAFSGENVSHGIILAGILMGSAFLLIEARRYRSYDIWRSRMRALQENLFANALDPSQGVEHDRWRATLSEDYRRPTAKMSHVEAASNRLRRVYIPLLLAMLVGWLFHLWAFNPTTPIVRSAALPGLPGRFVLGLVGGYYAVLFLIAVPFTEKERVEASDADHGNLEDQS